MAWTHDIDIVRPAGEDVCYVNYSGQADASDLTDYALFDISAQGELRQGPNSGVAPTGTKIHNLRATIGGSGMYARLEFDATTDDLIGAFVQGSPLIVPPPFFPLDVHNDFFKDPGSSGSTGDIVLTTIGGAVGDGISIQMVLSLHVL